MRISGSCPRRSNRERYCSRRPRRSTRCSTTGSGDTGSWRTARIVRPPPQGLSRGKRALSTRRTLAPARARRSEVTDPAGPAPTTMASNRGTGSRLQWPSRGGVPERPKGAVCKTAGSAYGGSNPPAPMNARKSYDFRARGDLRERLRAGAAHVGAGVEAAGYTRVTALSCRDLGNPFRSCQHFLDDGVDVLVRRSVVGDAGAEADGAADARVREQHPTGFAHRTEDRFVLMVEGVGIALRPAEAHRTQLDWREQFQRRLPADQ